MGLQAQLISSCHLTTQSDKIKKYSLATVFVLQLRNIAVKFSSDQKHEVTDLI